MLIGHIRALPLTPFQFGIYEGKRGVVFFGSRYDFTHQRLEAVEELPAWLVPPAGRASASRPSGQWKDDDFDVLADGRCGRSDHEGSGIAAGNVVAVDAGL